MLVGETVTPKGIGGEKAFALFRDVLVKSSVPIDHPQHLAVVPASPTRAAVTFDLVTWATSVHAVHSGSRVRVVYLLRTRRWSGLSL